VIEGITINLVAAQSAEDITAGKTVDVVVGQDKASVRSSLQKFVEGYNKLMQTNNDLTAVVQIGEGKKPVTGPLLGDSSLRNLLTGLRKEMTQLGDQAGLSSLAELGITTQKDGKLSIDAVKMDEALAANYDKVAEFMTGEKGLMGRLEGIVKPYTNDSGILGLRQKSLQTTLSSVDKQRAALDLRIEKVQERLFSQYNAMDMLVGRLQKTSESLANQLASLPGFVRKDK
jgi:flagellar hook-associated protein 2